MDLADLIEAHNSATNQVKMLESSLGDLQTRLSSTNRNTSEFSYLQVKMDVMKGVMKIYRQYRDDKWTELQQDSAIFLQSILQTGNRDYNNVPMTPPASPEHETATLWTPEVDGEPIHVHQLPALLTPIRDNDLMLTPPSSPDHSRHDSTMHYYSRNLSSLFDEHSRDV